MEVRINPQRYDLLPPVVEVVPANRDGVVTSALYRRLAHGVAKYFYQRRESKRRKTAEVSIKRHNAAIQPTSTANIFNILKDEQQDVEEEAGVVDMRKYLLKARDAAVGEDGNAVPANVHEVARPTKGTRSVAVGTDVVTIETQTTQADIKLPYKEEIGVLDDMIVQHTEKEVHTAIKKEKHVRFHAKLTNFLRTKHFMKLRSHALIHALVSDARVWMKSEGHTLDNETDYMILSQSVMAAFLISPQESRFVKMMENETNYDNMASLNNFVSGGSRRIGLHKAIFANAEGLATGILTRPRNYFPNTKSQLI